MYETLLVLHLMSVVVMVSSITYFSALYFGAPLQPGPLKLASIGVAAGAGLVLVFGVWLTLNVDGYELWDPWILASLILWAVSGATGSRAGKLAQERIDAGETDVAVALRGTAHLHWIGVAAVFVVLIVMIFKPGA